MNLSFSQFCSAGPEAYATLRRCVDERSRLGGGCEFPDCRMPQGCVPAQAVLGFSRQGNAYLLYWRPAVAYHGSSRVLATLFSRSVWRFDSYESMAGRLLSLRRETAAQPYHPAPLTQERPAPLTQDRPAPLTQVRPASITAEPRSSVWPSLFCRLRDALGETVLGQDQAVEAAAYRLYSHCGKKAPARPLSLIFYGPTGVGKSELGKALAPALERCTGRRFQLVWTELNTFTQPHSVHRLTGAPPGYVGYEDQPVFEAVKRNPSTVFMFDELEKAHPEVLKVFMSILDEGRCTAHRADEDGGRELDFRRCVFVFTTNLDLTDSGGRPVGFSDGGEAVLQPEGTKAQKTAASPAELAERLFQENESARRAMVRQGVLREIAGRFSGLIGFQPLSDAAQATITQKQIQALGREYGLHITQVDPETVQALTPKGALSARSSVCVLEGLLTPLFAPAAEGRSYRLSGPPEALRLLPVYGSISSSSTELLSVSYR
ncbi:AAA family ATPase [uncultured Oscillibacter sp.]|uniref:ATP-dependent Clp protease ATP-binding subunit n=1 Tax=uncultured Oscillibacter sp. TaxID=876091 RepID=UPI00260A7763|nr:AAA family ATPase [uncultured Oscillibacter sp.]